VTQRTNHIRSGLIFIGGCALAGVSLFVLNNPPERQQPEPIIEAASPTPTAIIAESDQDSAPDAEPSAENADEDEAGGAPPELGSLGINEGMDYADAKARLIGLGYEAMSGFEAACASIGEEQCLPYPEIESCSGTGAGYCSAMFRRGEEMIQVVTYGPGGPVARIL
jgi:hypothetical protein